MRRFAAGILAAKVFPFPGQAGRRAGPKSKGGFSPPRAWPLPGLGRTMG